MPEVVNTREVPPEYREELFESFYSQLPDSFHPTEIYTQVRHAYDFAYDAHYGVFRKGGDHDPYITHPVAVALIVANEIGLGVSAVVSALLHDVVEDTDYTREDIKNIFGENIARMVDGLTKITNVYDAKQNTQADTFRKMLQSIPHDSRVVFIKIADRLHNMRTMDDMPDGTRQIKAGENLYVYVPIADQLGLYDIKKELEDRSFQYAHPKPFETVVSAVAEHKVARDKIMSNFRMALMRVLVTTGQTCRLSTIRKSYYQTWTIMQNNGVTVDQINYESIRIIFESDSSATRQQIVNAHYQIYSSVITKFPERNDSKHDYVITPKRNGFSALVFQVMFEGHWIEIQIMTAEDDLVAHRGYSNKKPNRTGLDVLKENLQRIDAEQDSVELINRFRSLSSLVTIFVFTPRGSIVELPQGSTVLDFAYSIHSRLGNHCLGAVVGQKIVPINYVLQTTDKVTVLTSPSAKPSPDWFQYVKSDHARLCLDKFFKRNIQTDKSEIIKGKQDFNKLLRDNRVIPNLLLSGRILAYYKLPNNDELYRRLARQEIKIDDLWNCIKRIRTIMEGQSRKRPASADALVMPVIERNNFIEIDYKKPLHIHKNMHFVLSPCCNPISGDDALCATDDEGILYIHKRECMNAHKLSAIQGKLTTKVVWGEDLDPMQVTLNMQGADRPGMIMDIAKVLYDNQIGIKSFSLNETDGVFTGAINLMVKNVDELNNVIDILMSIQGIVKVNRLNYRIAN